WRDTPRTRCRPAALPEEWWRPSRAASCGPAPRKAKWRCCRASWRCTDAAEIFPENEFFARAALACRRDFGGLDALPAGPVDGDQPLLPQPGIQRRIARFGRRRVIGEIGKDAIGHALGFRPVGRDGARGAAF